MRTGPPSKEVDQSCKTKFAATGATEANDSLISITDTAETSIIGTGAGFPSGASGVEIPANFFRKQTKLKVRALLGISASESPPPANLRVNFNLKLDGVTMINLAMGADIDPEDNVVPIEVEFELYRQSARLRVFGKLAYCVSGSELLTRTETSQPSTYLEQDFSDPIDLLVTATRAGTGTSISVDVFRFEIIKEPRP